MSALRLLLPLCLLLPICELLLLIEVGRRIGSLLTLSLVLFAAAAGIYVLRRQGVTTLLRAQERLAGGGSPVTAIVDGVLIATGGLLLLVPGLLTDLLALVLLFPPTRALIVQRAARRFTEHGFAAMHARTTGERTARDDVAAPGARGITIEGDFKRRD